MPPRKHPAQIDQTQAAPPDMAPLARLRARWEQLGLSAQFVILALSLFLILSSIAGAIQNRIVSHSLQLGSLDVEQAIFNAALSGLLPTEPMTDALPADRLAALHDRLSAAVLPSYTTRLKLWTVRGVLVLDSDVPGAPPVEISERALTVATDGRPLAVLSHHNEGEDHFDTDFSEQTYEVYLPIRNRAGTVVAVGEIYSDKEVLAEQFERITRQSSIVRTVAAMIGIMGLLLLVRIAHLRLRDNDRSLRQIATRFADLAERNDQLLHASEALRQRIAHMNERMLQQIGTDLHDGPVQLLTLAGLYLDQPATGPADAALTAKARAFLGQALGDLRSISEGLVLPELDQLTPDQCLDLAVNRFSALTGMAISHPSFATGANLPAEHCRILYRVLWECLQNAHKHAGGAGVEVAADLEGATLRLKIRDRGPGFAPPRPADSDRKPIGLVGIRTRLRAIGGRMQITDREGGGTEVSITVPLNIEAIPPLDPAGGQ